MISVTTGEAYNNTEEECLNKNLRIKRGLPKEMMSKGRIEELTAINQRRDCK